MHHVHKRLLIVDDDPGIQSQLKWGFDDYEVYTADNFSNAITAFKKYHPPVVTLDLGLPPDVDGESEGFAVLQQIMKIAPDTKVIIVSGSENSLNIDRATESGAYDYYSKPVQIEQLQQIVESAYRAYQEKV
ncbi:MAG: response regulator [Gammaproteobacteria bacterium]|nr:response regulator [Gammaproteobacteria bacterium]